MNSVYMNFDMTENSYEGECYYETSFTNYDLSYSIFVNCDFTRADLRRTDTYRTVFVNCNFTGTLFDYDSLFCITFVDNYEYKNGNIVPVTYTMPQAVFDVALERHAKFLKDSLYCGDRLKLAGVNLYSDTFSADLSRSILCGVSFHCRTMDNTSFKEAELEHVVFDVAHMGNVDFTGSIQKGVTHSKAYQTK